VARWLDALETMVRRCEDLGMAIAGIAFVAMVATTAVDVVLRYVFNSPLIWAYPVITNYLIVALYFCAVSATQRRRHHVGIEIVTRRLPPRLRGLCAAFADVAILIFCLVIAYCGAGLFWTAWAQNEVLPGIIAWPRWPSFLLVPMGFGLAVLRLLLQLRRDLMVAAGTATIEPAPIGPGRGVE
jgi:TRAP-type C4-dicarboxylate transport system permease small subunit